MAHRYWRLWITQSQTNGISAIGEIAMAASSGGSNLIGSGTAAASGTSSSPANDPDKAVDGLTSTNWAVNQNWAVSGPQWWSYDFGTAVDVQELKINAATSGTGFDVYTITHFLLQASDDNSSWTTVAGFTSQTAWSNGSQQTFLVPSAASTSPHRYWRYVVYSNDAGNTAAVSETTMAATSGGSNVFGGGTAYAPNSQSGHDPSAAVDGNNSTYWAANNGNFPQWWAYDFGAGQSVAELTITGGSGLQTFQPKFFSVDFSDDNVAWLPADSFTASTYVSGTAQTFDLPAPSPSTSTQVMLSIGLI